MKTWTYDDIDKREWGDGPWVDECDKAVWVDDATGLDCMVKRNQAGAWCGYVGVPRAHPDYGKGYHEVDIDVHGGLTYAAPCQERPPAMPVEDFEAHALCHVPEPGRPGDVWWFGFDCHHFMDLGPALEMRMRELDAELAARHAQLAGLMPSVYRDFDYVGGEVLRLAVELYARSQTRKEPNGKAADIG